MRIERIRIGYVIDQLCYGGAEGQLYELVRGVDRQRFQCFVYCLSEGVFPYGEMIKASGVELRILQRHGHFDIARLLELAALLRRDRIDIVHSFLFLANGYTWAARRLAGVPHLMTSARNCKEVGLLRGRVNRLAFRASDAIVCNGEVVRSFAVQHYRAPSTKIVVIPNGVDLERFSASPESMHRHVVRRSAAERLVLTIGRLVPQKDLDLFLEAAALLARATTGVRFLVAGEGPCQRTLERSVSRHGLDGRVSFLGARGDVPALLYTANVFWLTSAWEGLPNVLLEAMACAKPVVTRDVGSCREIVNHGVNGYLVSGRNAGAFAENTLDLFTNPVKAREMGRAGRRLVEEKFSIPIMIQGTEKLYEAVLQGMIRA